MNFIQRILSSLISATRVGVRWRYRLAVCVLSVAAAAAGLTYFHPRGAQAQPTPTTLRGAAALEQLKQDGQYESLQTALNLARLSVSRAEATPLGRAAWHAPNPAAGYDAYVTETGVSLAVNDAGIVSLSLHSLGYGAALEAVAPGKVSGDKQTINIERDGVREWFVNGADGLEHGFTLAEAPGARQQGVPLRLALQVGAGWRAVASDDGKQVTLRGADGQAVEYGKLVVRDHLGRNTKARLTVADQQVVIEVEDGDAAYPLTIDPLFTLQQRLVAADAAVADFLGYAVALDGNTALIGAPYEEEAQTDQGAAYVFVRNGSVWTLQAKLFDPQGAALDYFGSAVALSGDTALIGAPHGDGGKGAAYVFVRNGTTWTRQQKLTASDGFAGAQFGAAVAVDGHTALIGAYEQTLTPTNAVTGAAYIFVRNGTNWTRQQRLLADDGEDGDSFGFSVALDGDTALVGAPKNTLTLVGQGAAYIFTRAGTSWTQRQRLFTSPLAVDDNFGNAVALSGDTALIGAYLYGTNDRGKAFVFRRTAAGWTQEDTLGPDVSVAGEHFGVSVALDGRVALVGASLGLTTPGVDARSAYVFVYDDRWVQLRKFGPELGATDDRFGYAVALDGDTALIGAYRSSLTAGAQGAAYAFVLHDSQHAERQRLTAADGVLNDTFGVAAALDGDTLVVGASQDDFGASTNQGSAYVFARNGGMWTFQQKLSADDGATFDRFGNAVALSGDIIAVGAYGDSSGAISAHGSVYVFARSGAMWTQRQKISAGDAASEEYFGGAVALSGATLAVGAAFDKLGTNEGQGSVYVYTSTGAAQGASWTLQQKLMANDGAAKDNFGIDLALDGDTLVAGASGDTVDAKVAQGSAYVFTRSGSTWTQQKQLLADDGAAGDRFGGAVALNGNTVVVGAYRDTVAENPAQGSAYVFTRAGTNWLQRQKLIANDGAANDYFGAAVALSGDTLVIGATSPPVNESRRGAAYVFTYAGKWARQQRLTAGVAGNYFGEAVALSGDTVVVGAGGETVGTNASQGAAYVYVSPVCQAVTLAPATLPNGPLGAAYDQQLSVSGGSAGEAFQFRLAAGMLPPGLTLGNGDGRPNGQLSGTPTVAGTYRFTVKASSALSLCPGYRSYSVTITPPCPAITVNPATLPAALQGTAYNQTLTAAGGLAPYSFSVTADALPPGLSLSNAGVLAGTPTASGSFNFTVTATDANGCQGARAYTLVVSGCFYTIAPASQSLDAISQTGSVTVATTASCAWTAQSNDRWITLSDFGGTGTGTIRFTVAANRGAEHTGTLTVAGQTVTITQAALPAGTPRLAQITPNAVRAGTNGLILTVTGSAFSASQRVQWNSANLETSFVSATELRAIIPAAELAREGTAFVRVVDTANGAQSDFTRFRIIGAVAHASAASYNTVTLAPDSVVAAFGADLATEVRVAESLPLPTELAGTTVTVHDSQGTAVLAPLFFVAPNQVNYLMPAGLADGIATVTITNGRGIAIENMTEISAVAPGLFAANASGEGPAAAVVLRIRANGEQVYEPVARYDAQTQTFVLLPIDLSNMAEQVYLILFGTGIGQRGALEDVTIELGETGLPVAYAGAAPGLAGVDQVNVLLPASLRGRGEQSVVLRVNDEATNGVNLRFQ